MMIPNMHLAKVGGVTESTLRKQESVPAQPTTSFRDILGNIGSKTDTPVQFSKHAALRLNDRNINLTGEQINRVADGIGKANEKGIRDSLVLVDNVALVVNVKSRTVITAVPQTQAQDNIFSNIDGAVIV
ncbi:MAG: flagellar protein [Defluviitaleaceae bacterium]|nr:flagellar protein [Defluviitaleaceae bacterium]MCL2261770.1 flagellar protein [Defluviitaleaceae bacterium]